MQKISCENKIWNLPFHKNQGFQKINDRNWARVLNNANDLQNAR